MVANFILLNHLNIVVIQNVYVTVIADAVGVLGWL